MASAQLSLICSVWNLWKYQDSNVVRQHSKSLERGQLVMYVVKPTTPMEFVFNDTIKLLDVSVRLAAVRTHGLRKSA